MYMRALISLCVFLYKFMWKPEINVAGDLYQFSSYFLRQTLIESQLISWVCTVNSRDLPVSMSDALR